MNSLKSIESKVKTFQAAATLKMPSHQLRKTNSSHGAIMISKEEKKEISKAVEEQLAQKEKEFKKKLETQLESNF